MIEFNTLNDVTAAVDAGKKVYWSNDQYTVHKDLIGTYLITFRPWSKNPGSVGLFHMNGVDSDYNPADFYTID